MADPLSLKLSLGSSSSAGNWCSSLTTMFSDSDSDLWYAIAGKPVNMMPRVNCKACYFVQGHAEHASKPVDLEKVKRSLSVILCQVESVYYFANKFTDEVFARIRLVPLMSKVPIVDFDEWDAANVLDNSPTPAPVKIFVFDSEAKDNGLNLSDDAKSIFLEPPCSPAGILVCYDVHGVVWQFEFVDGPSLFLLTTGWSEYLNAKKIVPGDIVMFWRDRNRVLRVGIQRGKESRLLVSPESVVRAGALANKGQPFEVVYYPRNDTSEFVVDAARVKAAMGISWGPGVKFKMPFRDEFYSNFKRYDGTVTSFRALDPTNWPDSIWRCLEVMLEAPPPFSNVTRVSPWMVEVEPTGCFSKDGKTRGFNVQGEQICKAD